MKKIGIKCAETPVGDKYVYECMQKNDFSIGGEQSGHIVLKKYATTGDGLLTAIMLAEEMCDTKSTLAKLCDGLMLYPQDMKNIRVKDKDAVISDEKVAEALATVQAKIAGKGRALLRKSGTEPVIRVMVEAETKELCNEYIDEITSVIIERGHKVD